MTYVTGEMEKIQNNINCLFFHSGKKGNEKALISIKMLLILGTKWSLVLMFQLPGSVLDYDSEDCQDHQFLLLKHPDQCLVTVLCKTLNIALKLSKFSKNGII